MPYKEPDRLAVQKEIYEVFEITGEQVSVHTVEGLVLKLLKYYHQGAKDAYDDMLAYMPKLTKP